jgi:hypothetical protein
MQQLLASWRMSGMTFAPASIPRFDHDILDYDHTPDPLRMADSLPPHWRGVRAVRGVVTVER